MLKKLLEERARLHNKMREMHAKAEKEDRGFTAAENEEWANLAKGLDDLDERIKRAESLEDRSRAIEERARLQAGAGRQTQGGDGGEGDGLEQATEGTAFRSWLLNGMSGLTPEERSVIQRRSSNNNQLSAAEQRALSAITGAAGGITVPQGFYNSLEVALKAFGGILEVAEIIPTDSGSDMPMPGFNSGFPKAVILGENTVSADDPQTPFVSATLKAFNYVTPILKIPFQFIQDSAFGDAYIANALAESIWRGFNEHATIGSGTVQPQGLVTGAGSGKVGATGKTVTFDYDDLVDLEHSVNSAYRKNGRYMLSDSALKVARKLKDVQGRPIWIPSLIGGIPTTLNGYQYTINDDMAAPAANAKSIVFGDLKKIKVRLVRDVTMIRLGERFADYLQVGLLAHMRADARYFDANGGAVKYYQHSAT